MGRNLEFLLLTVAVLSVGPASVQENVKSASEFTPCNSAVMAKLEDRCKSIVNQGLYFKKRNYRQTKIMI